MKVTLDRKAMITVSAGLIVFTIAGAMLGRVVAVESPYGYLKLFNETFYLVVNNYVQPVQIDTVMEGAYRGMLEAIDPTNEYLAPAEYDRAARGESAGPAEVGLSVSKRRGYVVVMAVGTRSPAAEAGFRSGDLLISIDGRSTRIMGVWEATQALRGKPGSRTTIVRSSAEGGHKNITLTRKVLGLSPPSGSLVGADTGVVRIGAIHEGDARRVDQAISSLKARGAQRLLLDLRGCVSDSLAESIGIASLFVSEGTIVKVGDRYEGDKAYKSDGRRIAWDRPLVVMVDEGTARTCEVVAAALRDDLGTPIVGQRTWGLGSLQKLIPLRNGDGVLLAVGKLMSPAGKEWNGKGIDPDLAIEGNENDPGDPQRQKAIDYLRGVSLQGHRTAA
jgi:carboxyl-terminal processing protease